MVALNATPDTSIARPITNSAAPCRRRRADGARRLAATHARRELRVLGVESALDLVEHALLMIGEWHSSLLAGAGRVDDRSNVGYARVYGQLTVMIRAESEPYHLVRTPILLACAATDGRRHALARRPIMAADRRPDDARDTAANRRRATGVGDVSSSTCRRSDMAAPSGRRAWRCTSTRCGTRAAPRTSGRRCGSNTPAGAAGRPSRPSSPTQPHDDRGPLADGARCSGWPTATAAHPTSGGSSRWSRACGAAAADQPHIAG